MRNNLLNWTKKNCQIKKKNILNIPTLGSPGQEEENAIYPHLIIFLLLLLCHSIHIFHDQIFEKKNS